MDILFPVILVLCAYLLGSASSAILLCRLYYNTDIRDIGSGNPGANNVQRNFGWKMGLAVFIIDFLKGTGAVSMAPLSGIAPDTELYTTFQIILGSAVILGHIFPVFFRFKGGKGVAVLCGVLAAIHPWAMLVCLGAFLAMMCITRYISLSVLVAILFYPIMANLLSGIWFIPEATMTLRIFSMAAAAILWLTHISNIKRLLRHQEEKFSFRKPVPKAGRK